MTQTEKDMYGLLTLEGGTRFRIRLDAKPVTDTHMIFESWGRHDYTPPEIKIKPDSVIIDIGAHIGAFSLYAAKLAPKGQVFAYEPYPPNFELLVENLKINDTKNVHPFQLGVLDKMASAELYVDPKNDAGHSLYNQTDKAVAVDVISLAEVFQENALQSCDLLKIDCEGSEYEILFNAPPECLERIGSIAMEYHDGIYSEKSVKDLTKLLEDRGFAVRLQTPGEIQGLLYAWR